jgi:serine phosphatase RsbU (regulator of sigma subunit)
MQRKLLYNSFINGKKIIFIAIVLLSIFGYVIDLILYASVYTSILKCIDYVSIVSLLIILTVFFLDNKTSFNKLYLLSSYIVIGSIVLSNSFFINDNFSNLDAQLYFLRGFLFCIAVASVTGLLGKWKHLYVQMFILMSGVGYIIFVYDYEFLLNNLLLLFTVSFGFGSAISFFGFHINSFFNEIEEQNKILKFKNNEVMDSIVYAKRIQSAILPNITKIKNIFSNLSFLYLPKDVVAGDFYLVEKFEKRSFFGVADATGHGVPGAIVSIVCLNALNRVLRENIGLCTPDIVLNQTREIIIKELNENVDNVNDGMDIGLCSICDNTLEFSGANISLFMIRKGKLIMYKGDRQPIGNYHTNNKYQLHSVDLEEGDSVYVTTDGYYDQFGELTGKKYKVKKYKEFLLKINHLTIIEQHKALKKEFYDWKGNYDQIDDVCLMIYRH